MTVRFLYALPWEFASSRGEVLVAEKPAPALGSGDMKRAHKIILATVATIAVAIGIAGPLAAAAFASTPPAAALPSQLVLDGCVSASQLEATAETAISNWSSNEASLGTSAPAGVTVNGNWFPAALDFSAPWAASIFTCASATEGADFYTATSQAVLNGCVTSVQLDAAATLTVTNWSENEQSTGSSAPAGVTVNGTWIPSGLLTSGFVPTPAVTCP
jgi:hypothetical protein